MNKQIVITNIDYFYMIDNTLRDELSKFEETLLPIARKVLKDSGIDEIVELELYPTEGYYYKSKELANYFNIIRNLQQNEEIFERVKETDELKELKRITSNHLFGSIKSDRFENSPLPRMKDIMTLCMEDKKLFPELTHHPWNIPKVIKNIQDFSTGNPNIVELASLINEPECLVAGCETNILYREDVIISGCASMLLSPEVIWNVDEDVQDMGMNIIKELSIFIDKHIPLPNKENFDFYDTTPEIPRVARLGYQRNTKEHYYWILDSERNVSDLYTTDVITTESYKNE